MMILLICQESNSELSHNIDAYSDHVNWNNELLLPTNPETLLEVKRNSLIKPDNPLHGKQMRRSLEEWRFGPFFGDCIF